MHSHPLRPASPAPVDAEPPPTPVSPALATAFEARGHNLLDVGQYGDAVSVLQRAALATGERVSGCLEPSSQTCLTYAYALYDLGRALLLSGHPAAAVPILERGLQIDNERPDGASRAPARTPTGRLTSNSTNILVLGGRCSAGGRECAR